MKITIEVPEGYGAGNFFRPGQAKNSALYEILNGKYHYWWEGLPIPSKFPESLEFLDHGGEWYRTEVFSDSFIHRWLKTEGVEW